MKDFITKDLLETLSHIKKEPSYSFNIGDNVAVGNLENCVVVDKSDDNTVYMIEYTERKRNTVSQKAFVWTAVRPIQSASEHSIIHNKEMKITYTTSDLYSLIVMNNSFGIDLDPVYQRDYVWEEKDKERLIESIFNCIDIGKIVLQETSNAYVVIDGKQRISTILDFYENRISYKGLYYNDLSKTEQNHFKQTGIQKAILKEDWTENDILKLFVLLNSAGKIMDDEHLNKVKSLISI